MSYQMNFMDKIFGVSHPKTGNNAIYNALSKHHAFYPTRILSSNYSFHIKNSKYVLHYSKPQAAWQLITLDSYGQILSINKDIFKFINLFPKEAQNFFIYNINLFK